MSEKHSAAHTPGPWQAEEMTHFGEPGTGFWHVNPIGDADDTHSEADARLIAAAPELLEALKAYVSACYHQGINLGPITGDAEAAIAKAERPAPTPESR